MKKILLFLNYCFGSLMIFGQQQTVTFEVSPASFDEGDEITIIFSGIDVSLWDVSDVYLWSWSYDRNQLNPEDAPNNGSWINSNEAHRLTQNDDTYSITFTPTTFYNRQNIGQIGFLVKAKDGSGDKKTQDMVVNFTTISEAPTVTEALLPAGMHDGLNLDKNDHTKATFVLYAPHKKYVNLIGNFNDWSRDDENYLLNKDSTNDRFWITLDSLTPQTTITYQYLVNGTIRIADPYATLILDEYNDPEIDEITYPNLIPYPSGKTTHAVSVFQTGETPYDWQYDNFTKPQRTDLVIYELLIRDFDELHSFDAIRQRLDYLQNLGINAIELMPVNEFDGNNSWGYNPAFHSALDKYYGTKHSFKFLIDECHRRGIAVILDIVYNHATGQHPYFRMWNTTNGGYTGTASVENPFFNSEPKHSYNVFNDFNHRQQATQDYVKQITQYWIEEYHIDGFRWDLTKGFTQNCSAEDYNCTNSYQSDRVEVMKIYADNLWEKDDDFYVIFEHLGTNEEETEWVNYRKNEGKGIMLWSNLNYNYNEATMGYNDNSDFSWIDYRNREWGRPANIAYMESHDEERLMFKNIEYGNTSDNYSVKDLYTALHRQELAGAFYFTIPGPKMIWQFGELGYDYSIDFNGRVGEKPIRWDYFENENRKKIYNTWSKLIMLKKEQSIFSTANFLLDVNKSDGLKKIQLTNEDISADLRFVTIIGNFGVTTQSINPTFQSTGIWYNLLNENERISVSNPNEKISLQPGAFKIFGYNQLQSLTDDLEEQKLIVYPNPTKKSIAINLDADCIQIIDIQGRIVYNSSDSYHQNTEIDISWFASGMYVIRAIRDEKSIMQKIVVQ